MIHLGNIFKKVAPRRKERKGELFPLRSLRLSATIGSKFKCLQRNRNATVKIQDLGPENKFVF